MCCAAILPHPKSVYQVGSVEVIRSKMGKVLSTAAPIRDSSPNLRHLICALVSCTALSTSIGLGIMGTRIFQNRLTTSLILHGLLNLHQCWLIVAF